MREIPFGFAQGRLSSPGKNAGLRDDATEGWRSQFSTAPQSETEMIAQAADFW